MKFTLRNPFGVLGLVVLWRIALLVFTAQPVPANDAYYFDGAMVNWLRHGHYFNPCLALAFPISGSQVFSAYPPLYQVALLLWMPVFGTTALSAMALHLVLFIAAAVLTVIIGKKFFPDAAGLALPLLLLLGITFNDRPEDLAHSFGLASLWLVAAQLSRAAGRWWLAAGAALALLLTLYTSVIVGAFYFGVGFITCAVAWYRGRRSLLFFLPFVVGAVLFAVITAAIARVEPVWWQGFLENGRQQPLMGGFRLPRGVDLFKLIRTVPVFLLAAALAPLMVVRRRQLSRNNGVWFDLWVGIFVMGWVLLGINLTLLAPNYIFYVLFAQVLLAAGLLALGEQLLPGARIWLRRALWGCVGLVAIRAMGLTTWGAACAGKNSYASTQAILRRELEPFTMSPAPVIISSPFLYGTCEMGVQNAIHTDWYFVHGVGAPATALDSFVRLRPARLVLSQFDYYRTFAPLLEALRARPGLVDIQVRDCTAVRPPDSMASWQRVVQHISWAPVIVDLEWKPATR
ncbi:MAG TPA: hypothetical protein VMB80_09430 [Candidatus Acidoferrum sp.]|nr:hypothetical protein [Candidatus Acidoferrum sp.]